MGRIPPKEDSIVERSIRDSRNPQTTTPVNQLVLGHSSRDPLLERIRRDRLVPRPSGNLAQENLECLEVDPRLELARRVLRAPRGGWRHGGRTRLGRACFFGRGRAHVVRVGNDGGEKLVVDHADLIARETADRLEVAHGGALGETLDLVGDDGAEPASFGENSVVRDDVEFPERDDEQFLEIGDSAYARVGMRWVGRIANGGKVIAHRVDKHAVVGDLEQFLRVDFQNGCAVCQLILCTATGCTYRGRSGTRP